MTTPEHAKPNPSRVPTKTEILVSLDKQLEATDENENPLERFFKRHELLEQRDWLEAEIDASTPPPTLA